MIKFKLALVSAVAAALLVPAAAQAQLSFNIGAVSLYKSSGTDQEFANKDWRPAIQGGVDYDFGNGFYVGNWNSTGKFGNANVEIDLYGGYRGEITKGLGYDVGVVRYIYPNDAAWGNGNEVALSLSYAEYSVKYTRFLIVDKNDSSRFSLGYTRPLTDKLTLKAGIGFRNMKANDDYSIGVSYDLGNALTASATFSGGTSKASAVNGSRDNRLVLGVSKSF